MAAAASLSSDPDITLIGRHHWRAKSKAKSKSKAQAEASSAVMYGHGHGPDNDNDNDDDDDDDDDNDLKFLTNTSSSGSSGMGCMAGILQLFDVHRILSGSGRRTRRFLGHIRRNIHILNIAAAAGISSSSKLSGHKCKVKHQITSPPTLPPPPPPDEPNTNGDPAERGTMDDAHQHSNKSNISANYIASDTVTLPNCSSGPNLHSSNKFHECIIEALSSDPPGSGPSPIIMSRSNSVNLNLGSTHDQFNAQDQFNAKDQIMHQKTKFSLIHIRPSELVEFELPPSSATANSRKSSYEPSYTYNCSASSHRCNGGRNDLKEMHRLSLDGSCRGSARYNASDYYMNRLHVAAINASSPLAQHMHSFVHTNTTTTTTKKGPASSSASSPFSSSSSAPAYSKIRDLNWGDNDPGDHGSYTNNNQEPKRSSFSSNVVAKLMGLDDDTDDGDVLVSFSTCSNNPINHERSGPLANQLIQKKNQHCHYNSTDPPDYMALSSASKVHRIQAAEEDEEEEEARRNDSMNSTWFQRQFLAKENTMAECCDDLEALKQLLGTMDMDHIRHTTGVSNSATNRAVLQCSPEYNRVSRHSREGNTSTTTSTSTTPNSSCRKSSMIRTPSRSKKAAADHGNVHLMPSQMNLRDGAYRGSMQCSPRTPIRSSRRQSVSSCTESCSEEAASESSVCETKEMAAALIDGPNRHINTSSSSSSMQRSWHDGRAPPTSGQNSHQIRSNAGTGEREKMRLCHDRVDAHSKSKKNPKMMKKKINGTSLIVNRDIKCMKAREIPPNVAVTNSTVTTVGLLGVSNACGRRNVSDRGRPNSRPAFRPNSEGIRSGAQRSAARSSSHGQTQSAFSYPRSSDAKCNLNFEGSSSPPNAEASKWLESKETDDTDSQGDKSTTGLYCEQPSPISVLDGPFYHEDSEISSPPPSLAKASTNKLLLRFEEDMQCSDAKPSEEGVNQDLEAQCVSLLGIHAPVEVPPSMDTTIDNDVEYVKQLLRRTIITTVGGASNIGLKEEEEEEEAFKHVNGMMIVNNTCKLAPLEPQVFAMLEAEMNQITSSSSSSSSPLPSSSSSSMKSKESGRLDSCMYQRRKLLFDLVDSKLRSRVNKWLVLRHHPWLLARDHTINKRLLGCSHVMNPFFIQGLDEDNNVCLSKEGAKALVKEVWEEVSTTNKTAKNSCILHVLNSSENEGADSAKFSRDGIDDHVGRLIEADILRDSRANGVSGGDWCHIEELDAEKAKISRDIERLIFKDLIDHILRDLGLISSLSFSSPSFTKRQLFN